MRSLSSLSFLTLFSTALAGISDIDVTVNSGPSKTPQTRCYNHEEIEKGDIVVIHFNASYHEDSPSGTAGEFITGSHEHAEAGSPLAVPVGDPNHHDGWDLALLGLCEDDRVTLRVTPEYVHGEAFAGKNVPEDAIVQIDVHIVDILVDTTDSEEDEEDLSESLSDDEYAEEGELEEEEL